MQHIDYMSGSAKLREMRSASCREVLYILESPALGSLLLDQILYTRDLTPIAPNLLIIMRRYKVRFTLGFSSNIL